MSLTAYRERIERAVAEGEDDAELREHLRGCAECRGHYDALRLAARALGDDAAAAERRRVEALAPKRRAGWPAAAGLALAAGLLLFVLRPAEHDTGLRGGGGGGAPPPFSVRVYAKDAPGQPVHLLADFPGSGEATVGVRAELQYFARPPAAGLTLVVETTSPQRTVRAVLEAGDGTELKAVGAAFPAGSLGPGDARVCAVLAAAGHADASDLFTATAPVCSTLKVVP